MAVKTGFWKKVADSDYVQLLSVAGTVAGVAEFLVGLFVDDPTETILRRIDELERAIQQGLAAIGDLINRQTEIIHQEFNTHDSETALSHAFAAAGLIFTYKDLGLQDAIVEDRRLVAQCGGADARATTGPVLHRRLDWRRQYQNRRHSSA